MLSTELREKIVATADGWGVLLGAFGSYPLVGREAFEAGCDNSENAILFAESLDEEKVVEFIIDLQRRTKCVSLGTAKFDEWWVVLFKYGAFNSMAFYDTEYNVASGLERLEAEVKHLRRALS